MTLPLEKVILFVERLVVDIIQDVSISVGAAQLRRRLNRGDSPRLLSSSALGAAQRGAEIALR
jgi:hypothetical protein